MLSPKNVSHPLITHDHCRPPSARLGTSRCAPRWRTATTRPGAPAPGSRWRPRPAPPSPRCRRWSPPPRCRTRDRCSQTPPAASTGGTPGCIYNIYNIYNIQVYDPYSLLVYRAMISLVETDIGEHRLWSGPYNIYNIYTTFDI